MNEQNLTEVQRERIKEIKEAWFEEISGLFDKWDAEDETREGHIVLDKHLGEQLRVEKKYVAMIQEVLDGNISD